jgi:hypothetical protein
MMWELVSKGEIDTNRSAEVCQVSDTTIKDRYAQELRLLGVIENVKAQNGVLMVYKLHNSFGWILK